MLSAPLQEQEQEQELLDLAFHLPPHSVLQASGLMERGRRATRPSLGMVRTRPLTAHMAAASGSLLPCLLV